MLETSTRPSLRNRCPTDQLPAGSHAEQLELGQPRLRGAPAANGPDEPSAASRRPSAWSSGRTSISTTRGSPAPGSRPTERPVRAAGPHEAHILALVRLHLTLERIAARLPCFLAKPSRGPCRVDRRRRRPPRPAAPAPAPRGRSCRPLGPPPPPARPGGATQPRSAPPPCSSPALVEHASDKRPASSSGPRSIMRAGISSQPISSSSGCATHVAAARSPPVEQREAQRLALAQVGLGAAAGQAPDALDRGRALGDAQGPARVEHVEQVRALQHGLVGRKDTGLAEGSLSLRRRSSKRCRFAAPRPRTRGAGNRRRPRGRSRPSARPPPGAAPRRRSARSFQGMSKTLRMSFRNMQMRSMP